jgi:hypothetical protein
MREKLPDKNWRNPRLDTAVMMALALSTIYVSARLFPSSREFLIGTAVAGAFAGISIRLANFERLEVLFHPISAACVTLAGSSLIVSHALYSSRFMESAASALQAGGILDIIVATAVELVGSHAMMTGMLLTGLGTVLVYSDRLGKNSKVTNVASAQFRYILAAAGVTGLIAAGKFALGEIDLISYVMMAYELVFVESTAAGPAAGVLFILMYFLGARAWRKLPISELVPREHRDTYRKAARLEKISRFSLVPGGGLAIIVSQFIQLPVNLSPLRTPASRNLMLIITVGAIGIIVAIKLFRNLAGQKDLLRRLLPYGVFAIAVYAFSTVSHQLISSISEELDGIVLQGLETGVEAVGADIVVLGGLLFAMVSGFGLMLTATALSKYGVIPSEIRGSSSISVGLFLATVGAGVLGAPALVLFAGVALATVSWESGRRGVVHGREIGRKGMSTKSEAVRNVYYLILAGVLVYGAFRVNSAIAGVQLSSVPPEVKVLAGVMSVIGAVLLLFASKQ